MIPPPELTEAPILPTLGAHVWGWYCQICRGDNPLTFSEIKAWIDVTGVEVLRWEIEALLLMNGAFMSEKQKATPK